VNAFIKTTENLIGEEVCDDCVWMRKQ